MKFIGRRAIQPWTNTRVDVAMCGRPGASKTTLSMVARGYVLQRNLPSGLEFGVEDPRHNNELLQENAGLWRLLGRRGLTATQEMNIRDVDLFDGERRPLTLRLFDPVGQVYVRTTTTAPPELQQKYSEHLDQLARAHTLWFVLPVPPAGGSAAELNRYRDDLLGVRAYLREALRVRSPAATCAVAIVIAKVDTLFGEEADARRELTDEALIDAVRPLVRVLASSEKVRHAAIHPVSAFGFGRAVPREVEAVDEPSDVDGDETEWILRQGAVAEPFNLLPLIVWSLLTGLVNCEVDVARGEELIRLCHTLRGDLHELNGWHVPLKGDL